MQRSISSFRLLLNSFIETTASAKLEAAIRSKFIDRDPINQECWHYPKEDQDHWLEVALKRGAVMQPWLKAPSKRGSKPRVMYPSLKRSKASAKAEQ